MNGRYHVRWLIWRDETEYLAIDAAGRDPWPPDEWMRVLGRRNAIGMVAEDGPRVVGAMVYELHPDRIQVLKFAVAPDRRRRGVGTAMLAKLFAKLGARRQAIVLDAPDDALDLHLFLRARGLRAVEVVRGADRDLYRFGARVEMVPALDAPADQGGLPWGCP